jgi:hypothetical protein
MTKVHDEVLAANATYAKTFGDKAKLAMPPARRFAILTCMDARLDPAKFAGLAEGDAHVIRNAGGRASDDAIRSLVISHKLLGTNEWFVIHHTDCGMETFTDEVMRSLLDTGAVAHAGPFFSYPGLWTLSRPVQKRLPIKLGAMGGPRSFRLAGEKFDGLHHALGYTRENFEYVMENLRAGAESAGRDDLHGINRRLRERQQLQAVARRGVGITGKRDRDSDHDEPRGIQAHKNSRFQR